MRTQHIVAGPHCISQSRHPDVVQFPLQGTMPQQTLGGVPASDGGGGGANDAGPGGAGGGACSQFGQLCPNGTVCCDGVPRIAGRCGVIDTPR